MYEIISPVTITRSTINGAQLLVAFISGVTALVDVRITLNE